MTFFYNGVFLDEQEAAVRASDRGLLYADGFFTTIKAVNSVLLHFQRHIKRLEKTALFLGIPWDYDEVQVHEYCQALLKRNQLSDTSAVLRITVTRGDGVKSGIAVSTESAPAILITASAYAERCDFYPRLCITSVRRNEYSALVSHKTLQYLESILARREATLRGFDEGIFLNTKGFLTEATVANLFFVRNGVVITPPQEDGLLPGIMRDVVITLCQQHGIAVQESSVHPQQLHSMSEAFLTNSLLGIQSIACIDVHPLLYGADALITQRIRKAYFMQQGKGAEYE